MEGPGLRFYSPALGRWTSRDPIVVNWKEQDVAIIFPAFLASDLLFCHNKPIGEIDVLGMMSAHETAGINAYVAMVKKLQAMCREPCCRCIDKDKGMWTPCLPSDCKKEAGWLAGAIVRTWSSNFGAGTGKDTGDWVGGYLCWDWARAFNDAIQKSNYKCWTSLRRSARRQAHPYTYIHMFVEVRACNADKDECRAYIDDGIWGDYYHTPPWPLKPWYLDSLAKTFVPFPWQWTTPITPVPNPDPGPAP
jgi:hypothetical protein